METLVSSTGPSATEGKRRRRRRRKVRKLAGGRDAASHGNSGPLVTDPQQEDPSQTTGLSATERKGRRRKVRKLARGQAVASHGDSGPLVTDPQQEDPSQMTGRRKVQRRRRKKVRNLAGGQAIADPQQEDPSQMEIDGSEGRPVGADEAQHPSVYITVNRRRWFSSRSCYFPFHKVENASVYDSTWREELLANHDANMKIDISFKSFVSVRSRWIVGVGGNPGCTVVFDTKTGEVIAGPKLVTAKLCPVLMAVRYRVYALSATAMFEEGPDFTPWFEVLDLSKAMDAEGNLSLILLDHCFWETMPSPPFFACKLPSAVDYVIPPPSAVDYIMPPIIAVMSHVVVGQYIVLSVNELKPHGFIRSRRPWHHATYAFDTKSEEWHKVDDECLPFYGAATQLGHSGRVFLGLSQRNGPINAYGIGVSPSSDSSAMGLSDKDGALKLSITEFSIETKAHEEIRPEQRHYFRSMEKTSFSTLHHSLGTGGCNMKFCKNTGQLYSTMLDAKLNTYQIDSKSLELLETPDEEKLLAVKPEISVSIQWEDAFEILNAHGFYPTPIALVASI